MPKIDLLPCPFCGRLETLRMICIPSEKYEFVYHVICDAVNGGCGASTGWNHSTPEEALEEWNTRASGWISCSDRFPEVREKVLALYDYCTCEVRQQYIMIASLAPDGYWMEGCTWHPHQSVTHWMPLPDRPKGE